MHCDSIEYDKVTKVYLGKDRVCRCGCQGTYIERGEPGFERRINAFKKKAEGYNWKKEDVGDNYLNVSYGNNRAITVCFY